MWHPATRAFDDLMREAATSRSYPRVVAVLVVAERLYLDWATRNDAAAPAAARAEHLGWVDPVSYTHLLSALRTEVSFTPGPITVGACPGRPSAAP